MSVPKHGMPSGTFNPQFNMIFNNSDLGKNHLYITVISYFLFQYDTYSSLL